MLEDKVICEEIGFFEQNERQYEISRPRNERTDNSSCNSHFTTQEKKKEINRMKMNERDYEIIETVKNVLDK